jgi:mannitol/fructose-specific phosphotransferase system IIA component (Ntr-type)
LTPAHGVPIFCALLLPFAEFLELGMRLRDLFQSDAVNLHLGGGSKDEVLKELVSLLHIDEKSESILFKMLKRRENLGTTGIGRGVAIPHCRSLVMQQLRVAYGRKPGGVDFASIDSQPVHHLFLIVAPPLEVAYLPVLGKIAQFCRQAEVIDQLNAIRSPNEFLDLLDARTPG